jgi:DNA-binding transcriptional LysR family regulator
MDRLRQFEIFLRVARIGNFTVVASHLGQSPAAVTRQINALEARLGVRLLNRSTRSLSLTEAGTRYAEMCERVIEDISRSEAELSVADKEPAGSLKLILPTAFGAQQLGDAIVSFSSKYPDIALSISFGDSLVSAQDFIDLRCDVALHWGAGTELRSNTLVATQLEAFPRKLCASPHYVQEHGAPNLPEDLEDTNCLLHSVGAADGLWHFSDAQRQVAVKVRGKFVADSASILRKAALAGRGVTILPLFVIQADLKSGALVGLLPKFHIPDQPLSVLYREKRLLPARVRLLIDFLRIWFTQHTHASWPHG